MELTKPVVKIVPASTKPQAPRYVELLARLEALFDAKLLTKTEYELAVAHADKKHRTVLKTVLTKEYKHVSYRLGSGEIDIFQAMTLWRGIREQRAALDRSDT